MFLNQLKLYFIDFLNSFLCSEILTVIIDGNHLIDHLKYVSMNEEDTSGKKYLETFYLR